MILPDYIADGLFDLARNAESPETLKALRQLVKDIRAAERSARSAILRPMPGAEVAHLN
jgi:hypothetical protein